MITRYKIMKDGDEVMDLKAHKAFKLDGTYYPADWFERNGILPPKYTVEPYDATPPPPPPPTRWRLDYVTVLDRLSDADADAVAIFIEGKPAKVRERLRFRGIWSDDTAVRNWLTGKGYDPDVVLVGA